MSSKKDMNRQKKNWDNFYSTSQHLKTDLWLEKYRSLFPLQHPLKVLDIGCGTGLFIPYYEDTGWNVTAVDYSDTAIETVRRKFPRVDSRVMDIRTEFPFRENSFNLIVADLSLHYFSEETTTKILQNIKRIMNDNGIMLARVNSMNDVEHGAGQGREVEPGYFEKNGRYKRFFTRKMVHNLFSPHFEILHMEETETNRYDSVKRVWEFVTH